MIATNTADSLFSTAGPNYLKKGIISMNFPDMIAHLGRACPGHFCSIARKALSDEGSLENTGFSEVTFTCCRNSWAFEAYGKFLKGGSAGFPK